ALQVALINETMASRYWPAEDPLGKRIRLSSRLEDAPWVTIVGIVGDVRHNGLDVDVKEKFYRPHVQFHRSTGFAPRAMTLVVKTDSDPLRLAGAIRSEVRKTDPNLPISDVRTMTDVLSASVAEPRFTTMLLFIFAMVALILAATGILGVVSYTVSRRTHEIGVRIAMGARAGQVLRSFLWQGFYLSLTGITIGVLGALMLTRFMAGLLYEVSATDPWTFSGVAVLLLAVTLVATYGPARRATRVDPMVALRYE
ncbi:FtsX-like permease family protein, partial [Acidobacteria bacterium AH-259-A15]|nr:FtsX-like permease family protein [Acidobacteria bacterium AH-259-A15]